MMYKTIGVGSWDRMAEQPAAVVKLGRSGLGAHDAKVLLKRASVNFLDKIAGLQLHPDETLVHLIGIGATEGYGANRNGDGFKEATCRECHHTFVKKAFNYKNHQNKDPKKSYGRIKASDYNEPMRRIELVLSFNTTEKAAKHNNGLVAEDWVLGKLERGDDIPFSMACKVAYDVCASCGNKARQRTEYCDEETCIGPHGEKRGGCKHNLTKVADDGHVIHVDNPQPGFFDMSHLTGKPADRIAYGGVAGYLTKAASGEVLGGAALAEAWGMGFELSLDPGDQKVQRQLQLVEKLAALETYIDQHRDSPRLLSLSFGRMCDYATGLLNPLDEKRAAALGALAQVRVVPELLTFLHMEKVSFDLLPAVRDRLPGVYGRMLQTSRLPEAIEKNAYEISTSLPSAELRHWAQAFRPIALDIEQVRKQAMLETIRLGAFADLPAHAYRDLPLTETPLKKSAQVTLANKEESLAWRYAMFKLAMLDAMGEVPASVYELAILDHYL